MMNAARFVVALLTVVVLAESGVGAESVEPTAPTAPPDQKAWVGIWTLDKEASDPIDQMMDVLEVPWYAKALAGTFTPSFTVTLHGAGLDWASESPLGSRTQYFRMDGAIYPGTDQLDRKFKQSSRWAPDGKLIIDRTTELPSGNNVAVRSRWALEGDQLTNHLKVEPSEAKPFELHRVFVREKDS